MPRRSTGYGASTAAAGFDGVHLDVEPWALPEWPADAARLARSYAALVERVAPMVPRLAVDIVPWLFESHPEAANRVVQVCDSITVMSYRDRAAGTRGIVAISLPARKACGAAGRRYRLAVETQRPSADVAPDATFGDDGAAVLDREIAAVGRALARDRFYDGIAVHHFDTWKELRH